MINFINNIPNFCLFCKTINCLIVNNFNIDCTNCKMFYYDTRLDQYYTVVNNIKIVSRKDKTDIYYHLDRDFKMDLHTSLYDLNKDKSFSFIVKQYTIPNKIIFESPEEVISYVENLAFK